MTFPGGTHDLWIRYWLAAGGIDPDKDVVDHRRAAAPDGGEHEGRHHGRVLRRRALERRSSSTRSIGYTAVNTAEIWPKHPEKALGLRAAWVDKHPKAAQALLMAVLEAQPGATSSRTARRCAAIVGTRAWFNVPVADILPRQRGDYDYGLDGKLVKGSPAADEVLARPRLLPVQVARPLVPHREHPLGQVRADARRQGPDRQGQPGGPLARGGQGARRRGGRHPGRRQPRQGDLLRRQGLRSRRPARRYLAGLQIKRVA